MDDLIEPKDLLAVSDQSVENRPNPLFGSDIATPILKVLLPRLAAAGNLLRLYGHDLPIVLVHTTGGVFPSGSGPDKGRDEAGRGYSGTEIYRRSAFSPRGSREGIGCNGPSGLGESGSGARGQGSLCGARGDSFLIYVPYIRKQDNVKKKTNANLLYRYIKIKSIDEMRC